VALVVGAVLGLPATVQAQLPIGPPSNDLFALGEGAGQTPARVPTMTRAEPPLVATPRAVCDAGSRTEPGIQGRVPAGSDKDGFACNLSLVAHSGTSGGFKVLRYIDEAGHECAFYDTALLFPTNATNFGGTSLGVKVLDMSDPAHPVQTASLIDAPFLSPHESLTLNPKRGLLAAVLGNPATAPGLVTIYDASKDCRHPVLQSTGAYARSGHESGFSPDGKTFYATATAYSSITAIDVTNPKVPFVAWQGSILSHGMTLSDDGNRAYLADATGGDLAIVDTSEVQARKPNPQVREISRLTWKAASIPQNAIRFTQHGHPYLLEFDEYTAGTLGRGNADDVGAGRIIDIADETQPKVIANLRLQVNQAADHAAAKGDPGTTNPAQGYAAHYCNIPTQVDPTIVACSFIASGLRVFDISKVTQPKEIAYYVHPSTAATENGLDGSNYAMSQPAFVPERHEIWYTDGGTGFNVLRMKAALWPAAPASVPGTTCSSRRSFDATLVLPKGGRIATVTATLGTMRLAVKRVGRRAIVRVRLVGQVRSTVRLVIKATLTNGKTIKTTRTYHPCTPGKV
jgi:hypothetical protein